MQIRGTGHRRITPSTIDTEFHTLNMAPTGITTRIPDDLPPPNGARYALASESELRIEVPFNQSATITLQSGSSEIFGAEMAAGKPYEITGTNIAIFTWHGCTIDIDDRGTPLEIVYISDETDANVAFVNTHAQLEALRDEALAASTSPLSEGRKKIVQEGPRVMLVGPSDCGKSSLARTLAAYGKRFFSRYVTVILPPDG